MDCVMQPLQLDLLERIMKKYLPFGVGGMGLMLLTIALIFRNGVTGTEAVITNLAGTFMLLAGSICFIVGLVTYFLRDDEQVW
jgi:hypothetical protein